MSINSTKNNLTNHVRNGENALDLSDENRAIAAQTEDNSIDVVLCDCALNSVENAQKSRLFPEIFRVLDNGGRIVIRVSESQKEVWIQALQNAGFSDVTIIEDKGAELNTLTIQSYKGDWTKSVANCVCG